MLPLSVNAGHHQDGLRALRVQIFVALTIAMSLTACAGNAETKPSAVSLGPGDLVRIIEQEEGAPPNSQPVRLEASEISRALASIRFSGARPDPNEPDGRQLFTGGDLKLAAVALQDAFLRAGPREDIALRLSQLRSAELVTVLRQSHITAARMFYVDDRLHVILGRIDEKPEQTFATVGTRTPKINYSITDGARFFVDEIGSRNKMMVADWSPYLPDGIQFHSRERRDWLEIDMKAFYAAANPPSASPARSEPAPPSSARQETSDTLEDRLRQLRDLHEEGLISDKLYEEKTRELVNSHLDQ